MTTIKYRSLENLSSSEKWDLLTSYIKCTEVSSQTCKRLNIKDKVLEKFIYTLYKKFQQARETKMLLKTQYMPEVHQIMKTKHIDSDHINELFLKRTSQDGEMLLTDFELLFCEFILEYGDDLKAIEKSKLNIGLKKEGSKAVYKEACLMRAFYLKRKPNIAYYLNQERKKVLKGLDNGKELIQENLLLLIEQLKNSGDKRHLTSYLKAIESLGRTIGAFDDKITLNNINGDSVLDMMLMKARKANVQEIEVTDTYKPDTIAYVDGETLYDTSR